MGNKKKRRRGQVQEAPAAMRTLTECVASKAKKHKRSKRGPREADDVEDSLLATALMQPRRQSGRGPAGSASVSASAWPSSTSGAAALREQQRREFRARSAHVPEQGFAPATLQLEPAAPTGTAATVPAAGTLTGDLLASLEAAHQDRTEELAQQRRERVAAKLEDPGRKVGENPFAALGEADEAPPPAAPLFLAPSTLFINQEVDLVFAPKKKVTAVTAVTARSAPSPPLQASDQASEQHVDKLKCEER